VDEELLDFIKAAVGSVWALELLLFVRARPERGWTQSELARELRSNERLAADALQTFEAAGLLARGQDGFAYSPASPRLDELAGRLAQAYRERPVAVVNAIVSSRKDSLRSFADAFRLKGGPGK
jgi:DNA-binding IclR family transcriptional regulator